GGFDFATLQLGAGGEFIWPSGFGAALELGYLTIPSDLREGGGTISPSVTYEFGAGGRVTAFARGGLLVPFRDALAGSLHAGFGMTRWFKQAGLRVEARDHFSFDR